MIILDLHLHPFAGTGDRQIAFKPGLNVVLGPNEAGKSTLVNALRLALFVPTDYHKPVWDREIRRFVPLTGGDTIRVTLRFRLTTSEYRLEKSWGGRRESTLTLPGGEVLTDPQRVQEALGQVLRWGEATYRSVLFAFQSGVSQAAAVALNEAESPRQDLAALLRRAVFETDRVSVERLGQRIDKEHQAYFGRWDAALRRPEGGRGIDRPWQVGAGHVVKAWYDLERARRTANEALDYERKLDEVNAAIRQVEAERARLEAFLTANAPVVEDARTRLLLAEKRAALAAQEKRLREVSLAWPRLEGRREALAREATELARKLKALEVELKETQVYESKKDRLAKYEQARPIRADLESARRTLAEMKPITDEDHRALAAASERVRALKTSLSAGRLALAFTAGEAVDLTVRTDLEPEASRRVEAGQTLDLSADGQIEIRHPAWRLRVRSGELDFEQLQREYEAAVTDLKALTARLGVADQAEAAHAVEERRRQEAGVKRLQSSLNAALGGHRYEDLEAVAESIAQAPVPARSAAAVAQELGATGSQVNQNQQAAQDAGDQVARWTAEYGSQDQVLERLVNVASGLKDLDRELDGLKPLPEGYGEPQALIDDYQARQEEYKLQAAVHTQLIIQRADLEKEAPVETAEAAAAAALDAQRRFEHLEREGAAVAEVHRAFEEVRTQMDAQTLDPWIQELGRVLAPLTAARYAAADVTSAAGGCVLRADGLAVPFDALSVGTRVGLGLAIRLSMARYFLRDLDGFLVLDDPLVDLDPVRQAAAAAVIREFAATRQVLLTTCNAAHADLLGGNRIDLGALS